MAIAARRTGIRHRAIGLAMSPPRRPAPPRSSATARRGARIAQTHLPSERATSRQPRRKYRPSAGNSHAAKKYHHENAAPMHATTEIFHSTGTPAYDRRVRCRGKRHMRTLHLPFSFQDQRPFSPARHPPHISRPKHGQRTAISTPARNRSAPQPDDPNFTRRHVARKKGRYLAVSRPILSAVGNEKHSSETYYLVLHFYVLDINDEMKMAVKF